MSRNTISLLERGKIAVSGRMIEALVGKYEDYGFRIDSFALVAIGLDSQESGILSFAS